MSRDMTNIEFFNKTWNSLRTEYNSHNTPWSRLPLVFNFIGAICLHFSERLDELVERVKKLEE